MRGGEGAQAGECDASGLVRLESQTEQLKHWHQPVSTARAETGAGWHMSEREAQVCLH